MFFIDVWWENNNLWAQSFTSLRPGLHQDTKQIFLHFLGAMMENFQEPKWEEKQIQNFSFELKLTQTLTVHILQENVPLRHLLSVNVLTEIYFQWSKCLCPKSNKYYILPWWQTSDISITKLKFKLLLKKWKNFKKPLT